MYLFINVINSNNFWWSLYIHIISSVDDSSFTSSFLIFQCHFYCYILKNLIASARASNAVLSKSGDGGYSCLIPNMSVKTLNFLPLYFSIWFVINDLYYVDIIFLYTHFVEHYNK